MFHRRNRILLAAVITSAVTAAMAGPAGAGASAGAQAGTAVPVDVTGDISWTWARTPDSSSSTTVTGEEKQTGTFHIDLTNVASEYVAGGDSSTYSVTDNTNISRTSLGCTTTDTGSFSGSGSLPYGLSDIYTDKNPQISVDISGFAVNPALAQVAVDIVVPATQTQTETTTGPPSSCNDGTFTFTEPNLVLPGCLDSLGANAGLGGSFSTYPSGTINLGCSGTYANSTDSGSFSVTGTLTITPSCGSAAAPSGAQRLAAAASACGLTITSPPDNSTIAFTDGHYVQPQPTADNNVAPPKRFLIVDGTTPCPNVVVNGVTATVTGATWEAKLPIGDPGALTLTANAGSGPGAADCGQATSNVTLINLKITNPVNDGDVLPVSAKPDMPGIGAQVQVQGYSGDTSAVTFNWTLDVLGEYINRDPPSWHPYDQAYTGSQAGTSGSWSPDFPNVIGGWGRLVVTASLPGVLGGTVHSDPRWIDITGTNPGRGAVELYILANVYGAAARYPLTVMQIDCVESNHTFNQFNPSPEAREPKTPGVPSSLADPAALRPLFGATPAGIGIAQLDPATFPFENWDWKLNVSAGIDEFNFDYATATTLRDRTQATLDAQYEQLRASLNAQRAQQGMKLLPDKPVQVRALSPEEILRDAIRLYNYSGGEYIFDPQYVQGPNLTIDTVGTRNWVKNTGGTNPNYVSQVQHCLI